MIFSLWTPKSNPKFLSNGSCLAINISHRLLCILSDWDCNISRYLYWLFSMALLGHLTGWMLSQHRLAQYLRGRRVPNKENWRKEETSSYIKAWYSAPGKRIIRDSGKTVSQVDSWGKSEKSKKKNKSKKTLSEHLLVLGFSKHLPSGVQKDHTRLGAVTQRAHSILLLSFSKTQWQPWKRRHLVLPNYQWEKTLIFHLKKNKK